MNNDTNQPLNSTGTDGLGLPADSAGLPPIPEPLTEIPSVGLPPLEPIAPPTPPAEVPSPPPVIPTIPSVIPSEVEGSSSPTPPPLPKKKINKKLVFGGTLVLLLLGGAIALAAQFGLFRGDIRQRASPCSPEGSSDCGSDGVRTECRGGQWQAVGTCTPQQQSQGQVMPGQQPASEPQPPAATEAPAPPPPPAGGCPSGVGPCGGEGSTQDRDSGGLCISEKCVRYNPTCNVWQFQSSRPGSCTIASATSAPTAVPTSGGTTGGTGGGGTAVQTCNGVAVGTCNAGYQCKADACGTTPKYACFILDSSCGASITCTPGQKSNGTDGTCYECETKPGTEGAFTQWKQVSTLSCTAAAAAATTAPVVTSAPTYTQCASGGQIPLNDKPCCVGLNKLNDGKCGIQGTTCLNGTVLYGTNNVCSCGGTTVSECDSSVVPTPAPTVTVAAAPTITCSCNLGPKSGSIGLFTCKDASGKITTSGNKEGCAGAGSIAGTGGPTGTVGPTGPGSQSQTNCGNSSQACCVPENFPGQSVNICNAGLYCNNGTCSTNAAVCSGDQGTGNTATAKCKVFKCGTSSCNAGNQCTLEAGEVDCASANLGGQCGQIDYISDKGGYCGVMVQNCYGSCAGG